MSKADRRTDKTRQALLAAFVDLVGVRGYADLRIGDIVERANVGRSTFYEHFKGKDALLAESLSGPFGTLAATVGTNQPPISLVPLLMHFKQQRRWGRILFSGPTRKLITRCLADLIEQRLSMLTEGKSTDSYTSGLPSAIVAFQLAGSHLALIEGWLWGGVSCPAETIALALVMHGESAVAVIRGEARS